MDLGTIGLIVGCCILAIAIMVGVFVMMTKARGRASGEHIAAVEPGRREWARRRGWQFDPTPRQAATDEINQLHGWSRPVQFSHTVSGTLDDRRVQVFTRMSLRPRMAMGVAPGTSPRQWTARGVAVRTGSNNEPWLQQMGDREVYAVATRFPVPKLVHGGDALGLPPQTAQMLIGRLRQELTNTTPDPYLFCDGSVVRLCTYGGFTPEDQDRHLATALRITQLLEHSR